jgi:hypothetical protein
MICRVFVAPSFRRALRSQLAARLNAGATGTDQLKSAEPRTAELEFGPPERQE